MLYLTDVNDYVRECVRWKKVRVRAGACVWVRACVHVLVHMCAHESERGGGGGHV